MTDHEPRPHTPRRVLITGASGGIGSAAARYFAANGIAVTGLSLDRPSDDACDRFVVGDATSPDDVALALADVDTVVHLAALPHPSAGTPYAVYRTNVNATFNVLNEAGNRGIRRAVVASSINASGISFNRHRAFPSYYPLDERIPADIEDAYSLSKAAGELTAGMAWRRWGTDVVSLRFPLVKDADVLREAVEAATADPTREVREGWSYLDTRDAVRAIHLAATQPLSGAHVIGLSAADTLIDAPTERLLARYAPGVPLRRPIPGNTSAVDNDLARAVLGFEPEHSIHHSTPADEQLAGTGAQER